MTATATNARFTAQGARMAASTHTYLWRVRVIGCQWRWHDRKAFVVFAAGDNDSLAPHRAWPTARAPR